MWRAVVWSVGDRRMNDVLQHDSQTVEFALGYVLEV